MQPWMIQELERQRRLETEQRSRAEEVGRSMRAELPDEMWLHPDKMPAANEVPTDKYQRGVLVADI